MVDEATAELKEAYSLEDQKKAERARNRLEEAEATVADLGHRVSGAELRVERAQREVDDFLSTHTERLLTERQDRSRETTADLIRSVHEAVRCFREYKADRQAIQEPVNRISPGRGQVDGPPVSFVWEPMLSALEKAVRQNSEIQPPLARWYGREWREREDRTARLLRRQRKAA